jgi:ketosteroid isomerase-like protein
MKYLTPFLWLFGVYFTLLVAPLQAQKTNTTSNASKNKTKADTEAEAAIRKMILDFANIYSNLGETKDREAVLAFFSNDVTSTLVTFGINEKGSIVNSDYNGFVDYLTKIIRTNGLKINYKVTDILNATVRELTGTAVFLVDYEITNSGEVWSKGSETVAMVFRKVGNDWKISHYTVIGLEDEKYKGSCLCELFKSSGGLNSAHYVVKTTIPSGRNYSTNLQNFDIDYPSDNTKDRTITIGKSLYYWKRTGEIHLSNTDGSLGDFLTKGHPADEVDVIMRILKEDLYKNNCLTLNVKR